MDVLKITLLALVLSSCAKLSYYTEQVSGQVKLELNGRDNEKVLADDSVSKKVKNKIKVVQKAKEYFFKYFDLPKTGIYDQTTILKDPAVTYLVVTSKSDKVEATERSFLFAGTFPYIGFFNKESALEFEKKEKNNGFHTYMRPVYAYSTLNRLVIDDNILSSFFHFSDEELVELIFHELIHTVLFVDEEVQFNENFAQFISEKLVIDYLKLTQKQQRDKRHKSQVNRIMSNFVVKMTKTLNQLYAQTTTKDQSERVLQYFMDNEFVPTAKGLCLSHSIQKCWVLKGDWNNARFAAFSTYEGKQKDIDKLFFKSKLSLKDFLHLAIKSYKKYDGEKSFIKFLETKV